MEWNHNEKQSYENKEWSSSEDINWDKQGSIRVRKDY